MKDSDGHTLVIDYDALDRLTKVSYPDGSYQAITYDKLDISRVRDRLGRVMNISYDPVRRIISTTDPLNRRVAFEWCNCGGVSRMTDSSGNVTAWSRDLQGRVISKTLADGTKTLFTYESSVSRLKLIADAKGQVTSYQYYIDNNLKQVSYGNTPVATPSVFYTYDGTYNRVVRVQDGTGMTSYKYYAASGAAPQPGALRLASADGPLANDTITYTYDELGRQVGRAINAVGTSMTYDALGRVTGEQNSLGNFLYAYEGATYRLSSAQYPNGQKTTFTYFDNSRDHRLQQIKNQTAGAGLISQFDYTYSAEGEIQSSVVQAPDLRKFLFTYDAAGQVTGAQQEAGDAVTTSTFVYDSASNRTKEEAGNAATNYVYNSTNQLVSKSGGASAALSYDANGNLLSDGLRTFEWDGANRLAAVVIGAHRSEFSYDAAGRRARIVEKDNGAVTSNRAYIWCGAEVCEERDTNGTALKRFFEQGEQEGATSYYYTRDHLGSVREKTDKTGAIVSRYDYDVWGRQTKLGGSQEASFGYAGYWAHKPSGLSLTLYRAYDPNIARWVSRDPVEERGGMNLYAYVRNSPVTKTDTLGLSDDPFRFDGFKTHGALDEACPDDCDTIKMHMEWLEESLNNRDNQTKGYLVRGGRNQSVQNHGTRLRNEEEALERCYEVYNANDCSDGPPPSPLMSNYPEPEKSEDWWGTLSEPKRKVIIYILLIGTAGVIVATDGAGLAFLL
jgi:RHS repeat-associated protein